MASLILGVLSLAGAAATGLPAVVLGSLALGEIKKGRGRIGGRRAAVWGIALGVFGSAVVTPALLWPVFRAARELKSGAECADHLKQIALAVSTFYDAHGHLPLAAITDRQGQPLLSWRVAILPYLGPEGKALFRQFRLDEPWDSPHNRTLLDRMPEVYACPDEPRGTPRTTNYQVVVGLTAFPGARKKVRYSDIITGTSNTLLLTESDHPVPWTAPEELSAHRRKGEPDQGSRHPGGHYRAMADGTVRFVGPP